tara:strand:+ start:177 stop:317 length:141 start_codon:yes stop_codon:yes gene_type:complete
MSEINLGSSLLSISIAAGFIAFIFLVVRVIIFSSRSILEQVRNLGK